jgi:SP family myo-inositol transporter-like MFS transporter 13
LHNPENTKAARLPFLAEIYPLRFRGTAGGVAATANWISNLVVAQTFLSLTKAIGTAATFCMFGIIAVVAILFVAVFVPETRNVAMQVRAASA